MVRGRGFLGPDSGLKNSLVYFSNTLDIGRVSHAMFGVRDQRGAVPGRGKKMKIKFEKCAECGERANFGQIEGVWLCDECAYIHGLDK